MKGELDSVGFVIGFVLFVAGVAMISVPAAFILAGLIVAGGSAAIALGRLQQKRRRES